MGGGGRRGEDICKCRNISGVAGDIGHVPTMVCVLVMPGIPKIQVGGAVQSLPFSPPIPGL